MRRFAFLLILATLGCSGASESSTGALPPPPPPPAPPPQVVSAAPAPAVAKKKPVTKPKPKPTSEEFETPNLYVVGIPTPNFAARRPQLAVGAVAVTAYPPLEGRQPGEFVAVAGAPQPSGAAPRTTLELPAGFSAVTSAGVSAAGAPLRIRCAADDSEMVFVPPGSFTMGIDGQSPESGPAHAVYVDGFYIDALEVTLKQYLKFRTETLNTRRPSQPLNQFDPPEFPVLGVTYRDAQNFAHWAGKELPTEAEWEKAARGPDGFEFPWGPGRAVWERDRQPGEIEPVGRHPNDRSVYGVLDVAGNAREWCSDWYAPDTYVQHHRTPDGSPPRNPTGPVKANPVNSRVVKGAGGKGWHLWARAPVLMRDLPPNVGIRCVLRITLPADAEATPSIATPAIE